MLKKILGQFASNWRILGIVAAVAFLLGAFTAYKVASFYYQAQITKAAKDHADALLESQLAALKLNAHRELLSNEVSDDYQKRIADLQLRYDVELDSLRAQLDADYPPAPAMPDVSPSPCRCDATAGPDRFSRRNKEYLLRLARQADEQTARLVACQSWINSQKNIKQP